MLCFLVGLHWGWLGGRLWAIQIIRKSVCQNELDYSPNESCVVGQLQRCLLWNIFFASRRASHLMRLQRTRNEVYAAGPDTDEAHATGLGTEVEVKPRRRAATPCAHRPASNSALCLSSTMLFTVPFIMAFCIVRYISSGGLDPTSLVLVVTTSLLAISCCCRFGCCRLSFCIVTWVAIVISTSMALATLFNRGDLVHVSGSFNATKRIAIVGGGPSGVTAAWVLALNNPNAAIDIYEYNPRFGGHSETVKVEGDVPLDIGFIFSTPLYTMYNALCDHFNISRKASSISVHYHGGVVNGKERAPWTNLEGGAGKVFTEAPTSS